MATESLETTIEGVCVSSEIVESIRTSISLPIWCPGAFKAGILASQHVSGVLLHGPPGTGKTMLCRAIAKECGARMIAIKPSDIEDKYIGESERKVDALFVSEELARAQFVHG